MDTIKVFISQPMNGLTNEEIKKNRDNAVMNLRYQLGAEIKVVNPITIYVDKHPLYSMGKGLEKMGDADYVVFLPGWGEARGCRIEHQCAAGYGLKCIELSEKKEKDLIEQGEE